MLMQIKQTERPPSALPSTLPVLFCVLTQLNRDDGKGCATTAGRPAGLGEKEHIRSIGQNKINATRHVSARSRYKTIKTNKDYILNIANAISTQTIVM